MCWCYSVKGSVYVSLCLLTRHEDQSMESSNVDHPSSNDVVVNVNGDSASDDLRLHPTNHAFSPQQQQKVGYVFTVTSVSTAVV